MTPAPSCRPERTTVVVVGIDEYAAGPTWNLPGASDDARRYAAWFLSRGVPPDRVHALVAPLPGGRSGWADLSVTPQAATREKLRSVLVRQVASADGDLLWVVWGGHGILDGEGRRRLLTADATALDPLNLDLDDLLVLHRSSAMRSFPRQLWVVDTCQTFYDGFETGRVLPRERYPAGRPGNRRLHQEVLFAASPGQLAANLPEARTGLFSREVLEELEATDGVWPPDFETVIHTVRDRFGDRAGGLTRQSPTYLWYRDAHGDEGRWELPAGSAPAPADPRPVHASRGDRSEAAVTALLAVPEFGSPATRDLIVGRLGTEIGSLAPRSPSARLDAVGIVGTCLRFPDGPRWLAAAVRSCLGDTPETRHLLDVLAPAAEPDSAR